MTATTKTLIDIIAYKLALQSKAVKKWAKSNNYNVDQLIFLSQQINNNDIPIAKLITAIINNSKYRISIY
jgi:hypothetical protein